MGQPRNCLVEHSELQYSRHSAERSCACTTQKTSLEGENTSPAHFSTFSSVGPSP